MTKFDRQREHQANERTFLAWLRTSIALIGFGFAIARFGLFLRELQTRSSIERLREHQANERTFLAWLRTSITFEYSGKLSKTTFSHRASWFGSQRDS